MQTSPTLGPEKLPLPEYERRWLKSLHADQRVLDEWKRQQSLTQGNHAVQTLPTAKEDGA